MPIQISGVTIQDNANSTLAGSTATPVGTGALDVTSIGSYATGLGAATAEIVSYDKAQHRLFMMANTVDGGTPGADGLIQIVDFSDPAAPSFVSNIDVDATVPEFGGINSVAVSNNVVAVAVENAVKSDNGFVAFYNATTGALLNIVEVGALPDMLVFTADGRKLLVANEGERDGAADAPGSVSLIDLSNGVASAAVQTTGFAAFDGQADVLRAQGVRIAPGKEASVDFEPEYISISKDGTTAFVTIQEANTVAQFDISGTTPVLERLIPLGYVDHNIAGNEADYSDRDDPNVSGAGSNGSGQEINLHLAPIKGLLMPDAISSWVSGGITYFVTANEGDARSDDSDVVRLSTVDLNNTVFGANEALLKHEDNAGRLNISSIDGDTDTGTAGLEEIVTFGGRGFTIFQQNADGTVTKVFESGGEFEKIIADQFPALFNNNQTGDAATFDTRSDDKGPEPEGVTVANIGGRFYAFVALEREGGVMVYDVTDPANSEFTTYLPSSTTHLGPETVQHIAAADSPTGQDLILTTNEISGTVEVFAVESNRYTLQLLHWSDGEAGLLASSTAPNLAALVDAFDDDYSNTLILAGGDTFLPGPFLAAGTDPSVIDELNATTGSTIAANATVPIGAVDTAIHSIIGAEASTIGNHEFDLGSNAFAGSFVPGSGWVGANFPYMTSNLDFSGDSALNPRFVNTLDGLGDPTATAVPEANTLKGKIAPATVITKGGEKIGLVAVTTQILESISSPSGAEVEGFPFGAGPNGEIDDMDLLASQIQPIVDELIAEGINKIVLMAHLQVIANEQLLATKLRGVDIILSAGSNTRLGDADDDAVDFPGHAANFAGNYPLQVTDLDGKTTMIVNTDNEYTYLGRLVVDFDENGDIIADSIVDNRPINGAYASTDQNVADAWGVDVEDLDITAFADGTKGADVKLLTDAVQDVISVKDGNVFGFTDVYLEGERVFVRSQETNLGNLSADANAHAARLALGDDDAFIVSLKNGGGIRAQIGTISAPDPIDGTVDKLPPPANEDADKPEGGVSQLDIENSLRFNNRLMMFDTTPQGLLNILNHGVAAGTNQGRFPQIGGVKFSWDPDFAAGARISDIALIDENDQVVAKVVEDGVVLAGAPALIRVVTINFTANGGDGYPIKANADNFRFLLEDGTLSAPVDEALNFTDAAVVPANVLGEQDALADYMLQFHGTQETAYDQADTAPGQDTRIQNLNFRDEDVFASAPIVGTDGKEGLIGGIGDDTLDGSVGKHKMTGGEGDDTYVVGNKGSKVIELFGEGDDTVEASVGFVLPKFVDNLILTGNADINGKGNTGDNTITGNDGDNRLFGGAGDDTMFGNAGDDNLDGGRGSDALDGGGDNDWLKGGADDDVLEGGAGDDILSGGSGNDTFIFKSGFGDDEIRDFRGLNLNGGDVIQFDSSIFADFNAVQAAIVDNGNTLTIQAGSDSILLKVKDVADLHINDFTFV
jgi:2',3'-cyclic-nucleotide 2'-phosphodiesterase (5'-nucleotidase family)